jgi:ABC-2 type transport system permease protein
VSDARILDRGYRRFDGERSGIVGAVRSVAWHTTRSILGLGRSARHKVFPIIVLVIAFVPAVAFIALAALIGDLLEGELRPEYWEFFGFSFFATMLFTAMVTPEAIVRDRRDGMFALYLSTPLTKPTYLGAKVLAVTGVLATIVLGPPVLWLLGYTFQSQGPDGIGEWVGTLGRMLVAGLVICAVSTAVSLAASSLTDRRAFASVAVILTLLGLSIVANVLVEAADAAQIVRLIDPLSTSLEIAPRLWGDRTFEYDEVGTLPVALANLAWVVLGAGVVAYRYRKLSAV